MFKEIFKSIEAKAAANNPPAPDDYYVNGLLYCGNCRTPKQAMIRQPRLPGYPQDENGFKAMPVTCKCRQEQIEEEKRREHDFKVKIYRERVLGKVRARQTFENSENAEKFAYNVALGYARQFNRKQTTDGLLFCGMSGCGKTYLCNAILNYVADHDCSIYSTTISNFERRLWNADKSELFKRIEQVDLLLLDDLFSERSSDYMKQITFDILDTRVSAMKPILVTTNKTFDELMSGGTLEEKRILSRVRGLCAIVGMTGKDRRTERLIKNNDERIAELYNAGESEMQSEA